MFGNFIYFIIVLLIYTTYKPSEETNFTLSETLWLFIFLTVIFAAFTRFLFYRLEKKILKGESSLYHLDNQFSTILNRQSLMAILLFAVDIYVLNLANFLSDIPLFSAIPTLEAIIFILLFICYLSIIWACAYKSNQKLYSSDLSQWDYILSHIMFSAPVLLPWVLLSGIADLINVQPFDLPKRFLATAAGEVIYFLFFLFVITVIGPVIIRIFWQCKPLEPGYYRERIENLCRKAGLEYADILHWQIFGGRMITAGVMGLVKRFRYILVTEALLTCLSPEEIDAVIAHEIGHIKKKHLIFYLIFFAGYMLLSYATFDLIIYLLIYTEPLLRFITHTGLNQDTSASAVFSCMTILIFLIYFRYIFGYFMRNFERQADSYVYTLFESAAPLISTFEKIVMTSGQDPDKPNWHHFSIAERIGYLKRCESDRGWIKKHDKKINKSIIVYLTGMCFVAGIGYNLNFGDVGKKLNHHFFEKAILTQIKKNPENANLYNVLGDFYSQKKDYLKTIDAYEASLRLSSENPYALNNLAWLYVTCEDEKIRNPGLAVILAQKAAGQMKSPQILDTLAEAYYSNGQHNEAIAAAKQALALTDKDRSYYEKQLEKFEKRISPN